MDCWTQVKPVLIATSLLLVSMLVESSHAVPADAQQSSTPKPDITVHQASTVQPISQNTQESEPTWKERLGIRHLTDKEWAQYELDKREQMQKR